ncbi:uncharacterized protein F5147DRAFT_652980 [Suillus discolor]|uniref:Uncharacterized protein n=1 Tax=Suillus discolor TaxID=1912936 RepID=A0A9P7JUC5_9AGAM|nr:uncharacterized protein F5147DRAFT_652980 [Suillus discolor]KAG2108264.1 hypothetical protein F5147DRAFT_652980 [Suillus discolor]
MSHRPLITSCAYQMDGRRNLTPMRNNHPKLHKLRKCTSLEWVYNDQEESDDVNDGRLVIRVGEDVAIFPSDEHAVPMQDESLPTMSYWYGKVVQIYLKSGRQIQSCRMHSDHVSVIDMHCVEAHATILSYNEGDIEQPQIPSKTLYNRWTIHINFSKTRNIVYIDGVNITDEELSVIHEVRMRSMRTCILLANDPAVILQEV